MIDFTSALYLGMEHASETLPPWERLTDGRPAALQEDPEAEAAARSLAELQGCEAGLWSTSTLHLFWDLGGLFAGAPVLVDEGTYAVAEWGAERAKARGSSVTRFGHYDVASLRAGLASLAGSVRPIVLCDGFCPGCGRGAPLRSYLDLVRARGGWLLVDDTQALGVWGASPNSARPYGLGGGGSLRRAMISDDHVMVVASLAKGFGAPIAALTSSRHMVDRFRDLSATRVRCSPPSAAALRAATEAIAGNRRQGEHLRAKLAQRVEWFRSALRLRGIAVRGGLFPVQSLGAVADSERTHRALIHRGVRTVLHRSRRSAPGQISFIVTARHSLDELRVAVEAIAQTIRITAQRKGAKSCGRLEMARN